MKAVGDAQAVFFMIEAILMVLKMEPEDWENFYSDLPNRTTKVEVKDKSKVVNTWDQTRCLEPKGFSLKKIIKLVKILDLQDTIDEIVKAIPKGRSFVRPSGTEDVLRIYAEADTVEHTLEISKKVTEAILGHKGLN
jgi:phosphoacetylglucosamine mutase